MDDNVWSAARLQEERLGEREPAQMYLAFFWRSLALLAMMSCARTFPDKSTGIKIVMRVLERSDSGC